MFKNSVEKSFILVIKSNRPLQHSSTSMLAISVLSIQLLNLVDGENTVPEFNAVGDGVKIGNNVNPGLTTLEWRGIDHGCNRAVLVLRGLWASRSLNARFLPSFFLSWRRPVSSFWLMGVYGANTRLKAAADSACHPAHLRQLGAR